MPRLTTLKPRLTNLNPHRLKTMKIADNRITGVTLQKRRLMMWKKDPRCVMCGRLTEYPHGFELDHKTPLYLGGEDTIENTQILCCGDEGCHRKKTNQDMKK